MTPIEMARRIVKAGDALDATPQDAPNHDEVLEAWRLVIDGSEYDVARALVDAEANAARLWAAIVATCKALQRPDSAQTRVVAAWEAAFDAHQGGTQALDAHDARVRAEECERCATLLEKLAGTDRDIDGCGLLRDAANELRESFHPNAEQPTKQADPAPGIVSPVATEDSVSTREKCAACDGSGTYTEEHDLGASETLGCQDCRGTGNADGLP